MKKENWQKLMKKTRKDKKWQLGQIEIVGNASQVLQPSPLRIFKVQNQFINSVVSGANRWSCRFGVPIRIQRVQLNDKLVSKKERSILIYIVKQTAYRAVLSRL